MSATKIFLTVNVPSHSLETKDGERYFQKSLACQFRDCLTEYLEEQGYQEANSVKHHGGSELVLDGCENVKTIIEKGGFPQVKKITLKQMA